MKNIFLRTSYNYDVDKASDESGLACKDDSKTIQSSRDECDINVIVDRFTKTGMLPQRQMPPLVDDFSDTVFDFQSAMNLVREAQVSFNAMDVKVRKRFNFDPAEFVDFCSDPDNLDEMRKMGLAIKPEVISNEGDNQNVGASGEASGVGSRADAHGTGAGAPGAGKAG